MNWINIVFYYMYYYHGHDVCGVSAMLHDVRDPLLARPHKMPSEKPYDGHVASRAIKSSLYISAADQNMVDLVF